ncbi:MAG: META domain-containing protein [Chloroflexota bacterium]
MSNKKLLYTILFSMMMILAIGCTPAVEPGASSESSSNDSDTENALSPAQDIETESESVEEMAEEMIELNGTNWKLVSYDQGGAQASVMDGTEITLSFVDGQVTGNSGCNNFFGSYTQEGETVKFENLGTTRKACEADIMDQENAFIEVLSAADGATINDGSLNMRSAGAATLVLEKVEG